MKFKIKKLRRKPELINCLDFEGGESGTSLGTEYGIKPFTYIELNDSQLVEFYNQLTNYLLRRKLITK